LIFLNLYDKKFINNHFLINLIVVIGDWGFPKLGIGDWGLGIGPNPQSPIPNPQSPIPNPQLIKYFF
jgi:hypothetical protein